jgi:FkbM family methyltransferase
MNSASTPTHMVLKRIRNLIEQTLRIKIVRSFPPGCDFFDDVQRVFPNFQFHLIVDVGANVGQSAIAFANRFTNAKIISVEPVSGTFEELRKNVATYRNVTCCQLAFGSSVGTSVIVSTADSSMNRVEEGGGEGAHKIERTTLDAFCSEQNIDHISFLKIDTEGGDLEVLRGAAAMLKDRKIDFVEVEAGMHCDNHYHVPMEALKSTLEQHGYRLFGIYEQVSEWPTNEPHLRRSNLVFLSSLMISRSV